MKIILYVLANIILSFFYVKVTCQLYDYCSNNEHLHHNKEECLKIGGCCFAIIKNRLKYGQEEDESIQDVPINSCFKKYKPNERETCEDYKRTTLEYENELIDCKCNDLF